MHGAFQVTSSVGVGSTFSFTILTDVPPGLVMPDSQSTPSSHVTSSLDSVGSESKSSVVPPCQSPALGVQVLPRPPGGSLRPSNLHGLSARDMAELAGARVVHIGERTPLLHSWMRLCEFYRISVQVCCTVQEARAYLVAQLARSGCGVVSSACALPPCDMTPRVVSMLSVDLDSPGVTEEACAEQLCTLLPVKLLYLYSNAKGQLAYDIPVSSPCIALPEPSTSPLTADTHTELSSLPAAAAVRPVAECPMMPAAAAAPQPEPLFHPPIRRELRKPFKTRSLMHAVLSLIREPLSSSALPSSRASPAQQGADSLRTGGWMQPSAGRTLRITNIANQFPLRYVT
jgi:hypothetical protein